MTRPTPEREAAIRAFTYGGLGHDAVRDLLAEIDALRAEREALAIKAAAFLEALSDWDDVRDWTPDAAEYAPAEDAYDDARDALREALAQ